MNRQTQTAGRYLSILAVCIFTFLSFSATVQAQYTQTEANQFDVVSASTSSSRWTTDGCRDEDDIDDGCYVEVEADSSILRTDIGEAAGTDIEDKWATYFNTNCSVNNRDDEDEQNEEFNDCWENEGATVIWPQVNPREYFEATGFCKSNDSSCSIRLNICYNSNECDGRSGNDDEFDFDDGHIADFFDNTKRCLFDVSGSKFTDCINDELKDVYDSLQRQGKFGFSDLEEDLEDLGVEIERYSSSVNNVEDTSYFGRDYLDGSFKSGGYKSGGYKSDGYKSGGYKSGGYKSDGYKSDGYKSDGYKSGSYYAPPARKVYQTSFVKTSKPWTDLGYWPTISGFSHGPGGNFILVNFTQHLEAQPYTKICGTNRGCINMVGRSSHFSNMGNISIVIRDARTLSCMRSRGYGIGRGTVLAFNDPSLQVCDRRIAAANDSCPDCGEGAKAELLKMYNLGLLSDVLTPAMAQGMQSDLSKSASIAPRCLCSAGFRSGDLVISSTSSDNPWEAGASAYYSNLCG